MSDEEDPRRHYNWSSIGFMGRFPCIWAHRPDQEEGVCVKFDTFEEFKELVNTLKGALNAIERERV